MCLSEGLVIQLKGGIRKIMDKYEGWTIWKIKYFLTHQTYYSNLKRRLISRFQSFKKPINTSFWAIKKISEDWGWGPSILPGDGCHMSHATSWSNSTISSHFFHLQFVWGTIAYGGIPLLQRIGIATVVEPHTAPYQKPQITGNDHFHFCPFSSSFTDYWKYICYLKRFK